ncbi:MAG TPA: aconitase X catalytic domain-containing protein [Aliidongia sp.]|uniref:aconitase X catalytic domain-containing protein n=1 Tax=Aliidongia sp. TaxID=1914230 RepID=UPI002DDCD4BB|nr:aconitase X catalytic domain-containing protein [Aliidongia sp.]HEV2675099.1 aconitase X catalytic domain-containing protein [Aliidongia sp.]
MSLELSPDDLAMLAGRDGPAAAMALRIVADTARMLGADRLIDIASSHIDGCLYHGDSGTLFAERLRSDGGRVRVPTTLNVGALDLVHPGRERLGPEQAGMARRLMAAYAGLGCRESWTCAPYQAGHRPALGQDVAWGESNAVVFCNSVLGARTNRYGDFLDICAAITGRAPRAGLHLPENRQATVLIDASGLNPALVAEDAFYPVLGAWLGATVGDAVAAIDGLPRPLAEDRLKALGAAAASTGAVGLFHVVGVTPEAPDRATVFGGVAPRETIRLEAPMLEAARRRLSTGLVPADGRIDAVAIGSPHLSEAEVDALVTGLAGRRIAIPFYACTGRHVLDRIAGDGRRAALDAAGVTLIADTCIVVTPILSAASGLLMTNSGKFAHYTPSTTGWDVLYGSLTDCIESAVTGRVARDEAIWR